MPTYTKQTITAATASDYNSTNSPDKAIDGNTSTMWMVMSQPNWIRLDLGSAKSIGSVKMYHTGSGVPASITVDSSPDGTTWTPRHTIASQPAAGWTQHDFTSASARYWRLSSSYFGWALYEVELYTASPSPSTFNVWDGAVEKQANATVWNGTAELRTATSILGNTPILAAVSSVGSAAATFAVPVPTGVVDGDWLFTFIAAQSATITADYTIPSGWARTAWPFVASEGAMRFNAVYQHKVTATAEPASYTWGNAVVSRQVATCIAVRYANATTPVTAYNGVTTETLTTAPQIPVVTVPSNGSLVIGMAHNTNAAGTDGTHTFPAPWVKILAASQPTPIAGLANDVLWLGQYYANAGSAGGQIGTVASGTPATDAGGIIVIGR